MKSDGWALFKVTTNSNEANYMKNGCTIDLSFWRAPDRLFDEHEELIAWARAALAAAHRVAAKRGHAQVGENRGHPH